MYTSDTSDPIGVIGLGLVGGALIERLLGADFAVWGYDIDADRCRAACELGAFQAGEARELAASCRRIILSLPDSTVVAGVLDEIEDRLGAKPIVIDTSTGAPGDAVAFAGRLAKRGAAYLDATISGSSAQVRQGDVLVMVGGLRAAFDECRDLFDAFAAEALYLGPAGSGAKMKLVTNLVLGLNRAALAEGLSLARALGLDLAQTLAVLRASMAASRVMDTKGEKMIQGDFTPDARLSQHLKDVRLILEAGGEASTKLPLSDTHRLLLEAAVTAGLGDLDNSAVIEVYRRLLLGGN